MWRVRQWGNNPREIVVLYYASIGDPAPGPVGSGRRACAAAAALTRSRAVGEPRHDPARGKIDVQIHQLLGRGAPAIRQAEHLMRQMQALVVAS